jgi:galactokinase
MQEVQALFKRHFGHAPTHIVRTPGRLELLGNHTDYNQGLVLALAVDRYLFVAASPRNDGRIELVAAAFPPAEKFPLTDIARNPAAPWADYVKGVLLQLRQHGVIFRGFSAAIHGTIPMGAGLSSSAALEVATALAIRRLYPFALTETGVTAPPQPDARGALPPLAAREKLELAKLCQRAESQFVGVNCGLLDQISALFGKEAHAIEIDCQSLAVEPVPMVGEIAIVVCHTGVRRELVAGDYNALRQHCEAAARALGVKSLRAVDPPALAAGRSKLTERDYQCALHVVGENQRVIFGTRALREGDFAQFGQLMFQSHESSRDHFQNSCPELDLLVELARAHPACLGARLTGGGFGGATINLVSRPHARDFMQALTAQYRERTGRVTEPMLCQPVDGAG